jgi:hypothetical protein
MPRIVIAGGTGFLGAPLVRALARDGFEPVVLTRRTRGSGGARPDAGTAQHVTWTPDGTAAGSWREVVNGAAAVVNLAGESIGGGRWTAARKQHIAESRVKATRSLAQAIAAAAERPPVFVSGSAVGIYGPRGDEVITEDSAPGNDYLAEVCKAWEAEARAAEPHTRVVYLRTGLALARDGGALARMLPPFRMGVGGPLGSGRQYMPWIHRQDWVDLVRFLLRTPEARGPVNATAPAPATSAEFGRALGRALHRPAFIPTPAFAIKLMFGEMGDALLLSGQRAVPARAERLGFTFSYPHLQGALDAVVADR